MAMKREGRYFDGSAIAAAGSHFEPWSLSGAGFPPLGMSVMPLIGGECRSRKETAVFDFDKDAPKAVIIEGASSSSCGFDLDPYCVLEEATYMDRFCLKKGNTPVIEARGLSLILRHICPNPALEQLSDQKPGGLELVPNIESLSINGQAVSLEWDRNVLGLLNEFLPNGQPKLDSFQDKDGQGPSSEEGENQAEGQQRKSKPDKKPKKKSKGKEKEKDVAPTYADIGQGCKLVSFLKRIKSPFKPGPAKHSIVVDDLAVIYFGELILGPHMARATLMRVKYICLKPEATTQEGEKKNEVFYRHERSGAHFFRGKELKRRALCPEITLNTVTQNGVNPNPDQKYDHENDGGTKYIT